jgi:hypothetical protein
MSFATGGSYEAVGSLPQNAENCARLAEAATNEPLNLRYKRMEAAWLALANEQDWLDGEVPPIDTTKKPPT